ncbi:MAG: NifB/NifX family molybdenum-iron cluster-binding protein [Desulfamplus sp.]|nr:NifB/NifX family molybdenum-iron cluster-binding protein [Desulfamplus sp.]
MKIAVTSKDKNLDAPIDPRFGRAAFILIVDSETLEVDVLDNTENADAFKGAGIQAASMISDKGAEVLLTGYCGPNAFKALNAAEIKVVNDVSGTVREAVKTFKEGKSVFADAANVEGHW